MNLRLWLQPPRRALGLFLAMVLGLAAGLAWLGWQVVELDRNLELQRTQERVDHALDLVVVSLRSWLDEVGRELSVVAAAPDGAELRSAGIDTEGDGSVFLVVTGDRMRVLPEGRLAYYPDSVSAAANTSSQTRRAEALVAEAGSLRRSGRHDAALAAYEQLAALPVTVPLLDAPAPVVARHARGLIFAALDREEDLRLEADRLWQALRDPRFHLTPRVYGFYGDEARRWSGSYDAEATLDPAEAMRLARAVVASDLAEAWRRDPTATTGLVARAETIADQPIVIVERRVPEGFAAYVAPAHVLEAQVRKALASDSPRVDLAVLDAGGQVIVGDQPVSAPPERQTRIATEAGLPWTLSAVPGANWIPDPDAVARQRFVLMGVLLVAVAVVAAVSMAGRALHLELEAARLQSDFVAAVSHEFRTPLAAFGQITELLADGRVADETDRDEYYRRLQHETGRLRRLVEDLLDFRRMEAGAHEYRFELVEVELLVRDVAEECQPDAGTAAPRIDVAESATSTVVRADREALARAVRNLIDNAIKYAAGTSIVDVSVNRAGPHVSIAVHDTGPGIAPADHLSIFEKFVRAGARQTGVRGTGLGLAMVRHIVAAHGGRIDLDSEVGRGSTFTIVLPAVVETTPAAGEA